MNHANAWSDPSSMGAETAAEMAAFLEDRAQRRDQHQVNTALCDILAPMPGECILEVGCGSGVLCRMVAPRVLPDGFVFGLDISPDFLVAARNNTSAEGLSEVIAYESGSGEALPYSDASFDAVLGARLFLHVANPGAVLAEMVRVVRPASRVVLMDWDYGTVAVDHPNRELTRRILNWRCDHHGGDNWSGRQLWRRARAAGLRDVEVIPEVVVVRDEGEGFSLSLWRAAQVALDAGVIKAEEHDVWIGDLKSRIASGNFFASIVYFIVRGWKSAI